MPPTNITISVLKKSKVPDLHKFVSTYGLDAEVDLNRKMKKDELINEIYTAYIGKKLSNKLLMCFE